MKNSVGLKKKDNVASLYLKQILPPIIWIFTEGDKLNPGYLLKSALLEKSPTTSAQKYLQRFFLSLTAQTDCTQVFSKEYFISLTAPTEIKCSKSD